MDSFLPVNITSIQSEFKEDEMVEFKEDDDEPLSDEERIK